MLNSIEDRLIYLSDCYGIGRRHLTLLIEADDSLERIFTMKPDQIQKEYGLQEETINQILNIRKQEIHKRNQEVYKDDGITVVTILDSDYPPLLKQTFDPPIVLYTKGDRKLMTSPLMLSVVGTRYPSKNGKDSLKKIIDPLIRSGWTIVSGLAYGIDVYSHQLAMKHSGKTIAVLGSGFHHIYPREHIEIAEELAADHLLLSEYPPDRKPAKWQFPSRNRIISGLSRGTLIIEAREKSGSLITGDSALQEGREVFSVPGSILEPRSAGTNHLIQQGAKLTTCADDIIDELHNFTANV